VEFLLKLHVVGDDVFGSEKARFLHVKQLFHRINNRCFQRCQVEREGMALLPLINLQDSQHLADVEWVSEGTEVSEDFTHASRFLNKFFFKSSKAELGHWMTFADQLLAVVEIFVCFIHVSERHESLLLNVLYFLSDSEWSTSDFFLNMVGHGLVPVLESLNHLFAPGNVIVRVESIDLIIGQQEANSIDKKHFSVVAIHLTGITNGVGRTGDLDLILLVEEHGAQV